MELRTLLTELEATLSYYWECPNSDQEAGLARLRAALAAGDGGLQEAAVDIQALLQHYWQVPNTGQHELLTQLGTALSATT